MDLKEEVKLNTPSQMKDKMNKQYSSSFVTLWISVSFWYNGDAGLSLESFFITQKDTSMIIIKKNVKFRNGPKMKVKKLFFSSA